MNGSHHDIIVHCQVQGQVALKYLNYFPHWTKLTPETTMIADRKLNTPVTQ